MSTLTIKIIGSAGTGKSTLSAYVVAMLRMSGIEVIYEDADVEDTVESITEYASRLPAIAERLTVRVSTEMAVRDSST